MNISPPSSGLKSEAKHEAGSKKRTQIVLYDKMWKRCMPSNLRLIFTGERSIISHKTEIKKKWCKLSVFLYFTV
jgi:hypothetical protein